MFAENFTHFIHRGFYDDIEIEDMDFDEDVSSDDSGQDDRCDIGLDNVKDGGDKDEGRGRDGAGAFRE